jgi:hypothetical protein
MEEREEVLDYGGLDNDELRDIILKLCYHLNLKLIKVTNTYWSVGHPDRVKFELEEIK